MNRMSVCWVMVIYFTVFPAVTFAASMEVEVADLSHLPPMITQSANLQEDVTISDKGVVTIKVSVR